MPNIISSFRLMASPVLLLVTWHDRSELFLAILALSLFSDAIDGMIARRLKVTTKLGAKLDSWADFITYLTVALCAWRLWPEILKREIFFVGAGIVFLILPVLAGFVKFKQLPSYHTCAAKILAVLMSIAIFTLFITGIVWPFQCAVILQFFVAIEEIAITLLLKEQRHNIPSFWHLIHSPSQV